MASLLTHPLTKGLFLGAAVLAGITAVFAYSDEVVLALESLPASNVLAAGIASVGYVVATMCCWRAILHDLGSPLSTARASRLFFVSQLGKYIPGGVWNVVAVGEMGRERGVPRRSSFGSMLIFWGVSVTTGLAVGATYAVAARAQIAGGWLWVTATLVLGLALLSPPVLRKLLRIGLRTLKRRPLDREPTAAGLLRAVVWALLGWVCAGLQVWSIASPMSETTVPALAALGGYALAWTAGFLVVVAPAGVGVREVVLGGLFAGFMDAGAVVILVLLSRFLITIADFLLAALATLLPDRTASPTE